MKILDITRSLKNGMIVFPGDIVPSFNQQDHGRYFISDLYLSSHTGTHIDAPTHYLKSGDTIDTVPLGNLIGRCHVSEIEGDDVLITASRLRGRIGNESRLLLKTPFSGKTTFSEDYPCLTPDAARLITDKGVICLGIDSPSIEAFVGDGSVHRQLLGNGCLVIELLDLSGVAEGDYGMVALPLRLEGLDGAPARVILTQPEER